MSTTVIKDVTRGLQALLLNQLNPGGTSTAQVSLVPPGETLPKGLGVNLYLYRVIESPSTKNQMWPNDRTAPGDENSSPGLGTVVPVDSFRHRTGCHQHIRGRCAYHPRHGDVDLS